MREYWVYVMSNLARTISVGVTGNLERRVCEHKQGSLDGFTKRYKLTRLVYAESSDDVEAAIAREKQLKGWRRERKLALIDDQNPAWDDIAADWDCPVYDEDTDSSAEASE